MKRVFVSYSHEDQDLVTPVVAMLRLTDANVFQDRDSIKPGTLWPFAIERAIAKANTFLLFWCAHAQWSKEIAKEYGAALKREKSICPVLLDSTPLPEPLARWQWIDFRALQTHSPVRHKRADSEMDSVDYYSSQDSDLPSGSLSEYTLSPSGETVKSMATAIRLRLLSV